MVEPLHLYLIADSVRVCTHTPEKQDECSSVCSELHQKHFVHTADECHSSETSLLSLESVPSMLSLRLSGFSDKSCDEATSNV